MIPTKEHPIIFSTDMVKAILENRKIQTRRVIKPQPDRYAYEAARSTLANLGDLWDWRRRDNKAPHNPIAFKCPYGFVGSRLWVREGYFIRDVNGKILYEADKPDALNGIVDGLGRNLYHWKTPLFMPRKFSRITLEITSIEVEKLQSISEEDAKKEGVAPYPFMATMLNKKTMQFDTDEHFHCRHFRNVWDSLNGTAYPWESNPFVWVLEFRRIEP